MTVMHLMLLPNVPIGLGNCTILRSQHAAPRDPEREFLRDEQNVTVTGRFLEVLSLDTESVAQVVWARLATGHNLVLTIE